MPLPFLVFPASDEHERKTLTAQTMQDLAPFGPVFIVVAVLVMVVAILVGGDRCSVVST